MVMGYRRVMKILCTCGRMLYVDRCCRAKFCIDNVCLVTIILEDPALLEEKAVYLLCMDMYSIFKATHLSLSLSCCVTKSYNDTLKIHLKKNIRKLHIALYYYSFLFPCNLIGRFLSANNLVLSQSVKQLLYPLKTCFTRWSTALPGPNGSPGL